MDDALAARVMAAIAEIKKIPLGSISPDSTFEQLAIDSLDAMNLLFLLEEQLGVSVPDELASSFHDVGSAVAGIKRLLAERSASQAHNAA